MTYTTTRENWDPGEYTTDAPPEHVHALMQAAKDKDTRTLYGVGGDMGQLAAFGRAHAFHSETGQARTYTFSPTARLFLPGSAAARREVPAEAMHGSNHWQVEPMDPRELTGTQDGLQGAALSHYLSDDYRKGGHLFDKSRGADNDIPTVVGFQRRKFLMTGHHRAAAALLKGEPLQARFRHIS